MELLLNNEDSTIQDKLIELIEMNESIRILSPYLTKNKALNCILQKSDFKLKLILNFDPKSILNRIPSIDINLIKVLIESGHEVFNNRELHSKLYITDESLILGSSNFTDYGLRTRKESAIHLKRDSNPNIYDECKKYFDSILKSSTNVTLSQINKTIKILAQSDYLDRDKLEKLADIFSGNNIKDSFVNDYELKYYYPKTLQELQNGLRFDLINYQEIEMQYKAYFQGSGREKDEIISFIRTHLYENNKGYNIKTKIQGITPSLYLWYFHNESELGFELKPYSEFYIDRSIEILKLYRKSFDIQPATGFFAKKYEYLKGKEKINDDFFSVKLSVFKENWDFNLLKERLDEIDEYFICHHFPDRNARMKIKKMRTQGTLNIDIERSLRYEGSLSDRLYQIRKKYKGNSSYSHDSMKLIENYFNKWGSFLKEK